MTAYEQGFFTKCAEYGVDSGTASEMLKQAFLWSHKSARQTNALRNMQNEALRKAYAGGYDKYLPKEYRAGSTNMPGTWLGRTVRRWFHGASGFANSYRSDMERAMDQARTKYLEEYRAASPEVQRLMREEVRQRRRSYDADELAKARARNPLGAAEIDRQKAEEEKAKQQQTPAAQPLPIDRVAYWKQQIGDGKMTIPSITQHYYDPKTAQLYRTDGKPLHSVASQWNEKIQSGTITPPQAKPAAGTPAKEPPPASFNAPRVGY